MYCCCFSLVFHSRVVKEEEAREGPPEGRHILFELATYLELCCCCCNTTTTHIYSLKEEKGKHLSNTQNISKRAGMTNQRHGYVYIQKGRRDQKEKKKESHTPSTTVSDSHIYSPTDSTYPPFNLAFSFSYSFPPLPSPPTRA